MMIGHLPAGYLLARILKSKRLGAGFVFWAILLGSVLPDADMLWFLFVDGGSVHHHTYLTHRPMIWLGLLLVGWATGQSFIKSLGIGALLHVALDSIAGQINWGWPFFDLSVTLVTVPATHKHWVGSFLLHWTFAVELIILCIAVVLALRSRR